ncbi:MAG: hypothetical protein PGN25_00560 [Methylorubrum populi]
MLLETLLALTTLMPQVERAAEAARARLPVLARTLPRTAEAAPAAPPSLGLVARAVSNWRAQAGENLAPGSLAFVVRHAASEPGFVARCVRLNNYWCIKQAGWTGELGGDAEGHTGFATAADGADAAVQLLRRYQRDHGRRTALAIVRRWAPAECGSVRPIPVAAARGASSGGPERVKAPAISAAVAPQGIGRTLRARFLARHGRGGVARVASPPAGGLRVQPWSARARLAGHPGRAAARPAAARAGSSKPIAPIPKGTADIATGIADAPTRIASLAPTPTTVSARAPARSGATDPAALLASDRLAAEAAALPSIAASLPKGSLLDLSLPAPVCAGDETRIRNYAARIAGSVGLKPDDDLGLFRDDGSPTEHLLPVMLAMSSVELGTLHASKALVSAAIERLAARAPGTAAAEPARKSAL